MFHIGTPMIWNFLPPFVHFKTWILSERILQLICSCLLLIAPGNKSWATKFIRQLSLMFCTALVCVLLILFVFRFSIVLVHTLVIIVHYFCSDNIIQWSECPVVYPEGGKGNRNPTNLWHIFLMFSKLLTMIHSVEWLWHLITDHISMGGNALASICWSVHLSDCFHSIFRTDWPLVLIIFMCVGLYRGLQEIKLKVTRKGQDALGLTSVLDRGPFSS